MHVVNALLYAELANRIPIVLWKERCLYYDNIEPKDGDGHCNNAFEYYFNPVSAYSIKDIIGKGYTYFPAIWNDANIVNDRACSQSVRLPADLNFPGSDADVLVSSHLQRIEDLQNNIPASSVLSKFSKEEIWYTFYTRYIRLKDEIQGKIDRFWSNDFDGMNVLGVHIRKTDKRLEQAAPHDGRFVTAIDSYLRSFNDAKIFMATDSSRTLRKFINRYGERVMYTDCIRSDGSSAVHITGGSGRKKGEQILIDMYLLSKCTHFIGSLSTNVSYVVLYMLCAPQVAASKSTIIRHNLLENIERRMVACMWRSAKRVSRIGLNRWVSMVYGILGRVSI